MTIDPLSDPRVAPTAPDEDPEGLPVPQEPDDPETDEELAGDDESGTPDGL